MKRGLTDITNAKRGNTDINFVYRGENLIWQRNALQGIDFALSMRNIGLGNDLTMRVRRDGASPATQDFTYQEILDGTLATWVGVGNNGFCTIYYDRIGSNNAFQNTSTLQPIIVENGVVNLENGLPALKFDGSRLLDLTTPIIYVNLFSVQRSEDSKLIFGDTNAPRIRLRSNTTPPSLQYNVPGVDINSQFWGYASGIPLGQQYLINANTNNNTGYVNDSAPDNTLTIVPSFSIRSIGGFTPDLIGSFQELLLTTSAITNDADIRNNIINAYNIP